MTDKLTPFSWQEEPIETMVKAIMDGKSILDASDTGIGKTVHVLLAAKRMGIVLGIICPKSVIPAWRDLAGRAGVKTVFISNIEKLKAQKKYLRQVHKWWHWDIPNDVFLVFDEVHRFSAYNTQNAKILSSAPNPVFMLSATAAMDPTKMRAIGSQLELTTWNSWWEWCGRNGCKRGYWGGIEFRGNKDHLDRLHRQIFKTGRGVRVRISDLGDKFPRNRVEMVSVPVEDQKSIDEAYTEEMQALALNAKPLEAIIRARQICEHQKIPSVIDLTDDLVDSGNSVVIFVNFLDTLNRLKEAFDEGVCVIHGLQNAEERQDHIDRFQRNKIRIMVCMIQAGGVGLSLHDEDGLHPRVSVVLPGWSAIDLRQALGRIPRAVSKSACLQKILFADGTIDERVRTKVEKKLEHIDLLNDGDLTAK